MQAQKSRQVAHWWPLAALVLAGAARSVVADAHPETGTSAASMALGCAWAAGLMFLLPVRSDEGQKGSAWRAMLAGAMVLGGPLLSVLLLGSAPVDANGLTVALVLTAVVVAVASAAMSGEAEDIAARLWPGLVAVGGLLLVLPPPDVNHAGGDAVLVLAPVLAGVGAVWFVQQRGGLRRRLGLALVGAAVVFLIAAAVAWTLWGRPAVSVQAVAWDGVIAVLGLLSLSRLGVVRWSAQFVLLPFAVLLLGLIVVRPALDWRMLLGLALIVMAGGYLLWEPGGNAEPDRDKPGPG